MFWYGGGMGAWGYVLMTISMVAFWGLVIAGVVALVHYAGRGSHDARPLPKTAEQVLAERFARGEIDEQEYRHRWEALQTLPHSPPESR